MGSKGCTSRRFPVCLTVHRECGLVKMDFLGLQTLTLIKNTEMLIKETNPDFDVATVSDSDTATFDLFRTGKTTGVFQFESSGMRNIVKRAKPKHMEDLIALNALYRPGPMDYIDQFIDSKNGTQPVAYQLPELNDVLKETYGLIIYQEQLMEIARFVGGYTLSRADILRRAIRKQNAKVIANEKRTFLQGAKNQGFTEKQASKVFDFLTQSAGYVVSKSHAAAYAVLGYKTAYLKANFPTEFLAATDAERFPSKS